MLADWQEIEPGLKARVSVTRISQSDRKCVHSYYTMPLESHDRQKLVYFRFANHAPLLAPESGAEVDLGNPPFTVATLASLQAAEVVRVLLGREGVYSRRLLFVDLEDGTFRTLDLV